MYSINVLVICYKQEELIARALDSVLCQKNYGLKNIVIQDDCSPDRTWNIIQEYKRKYPDVIIPYRNEHNLGIYGNLEKLIVNRNIADLYCILSGDDSFNDGWFMTIQNYLVKNDINLHGVAATIFSDYKIVRPNGLSLINRDNKLVKKNIDLVSMKIRLCITGRSTISTKAVFDQYKPFPMNDGLAVAECMSDIQPMLYTQKAYYVPFVASTYYTHIGISTKLNNPEAYKDRIRSVEWMQKNVTMDAIAFKFLNFRKAYYEFLIDPSWKKYRYFFSLYWKAFDKYTLQGSRPIMHLLLFKRAIMKLLYKK